MSPEPEPTTDLVRRVRDGNRQAAEELYHRYAGYLVGVVRKSTATWLDGRIDPESVVLSAFKSLLESLQKGQYAETASGELRRLLTRIAQNKLNDRVRDLERRAGPEPPADDAAAPLDDEPTPAEEAEVKESFDRVLAGLDAEQLAVFQMLFLGRRSVEEAAAELNTSQRTVYRARETIRDRFEKVFGPEDR